MSVVSFDDATLKQINQVQYEVINNQRKEIERLQEQIRHLERLLFSRAVLLNPSNDSNEGNESEKL